MLQSTRSNDTRSLRNVAIPSGPVPPPSRPARVGLPRNPAARTGPPLKPTTRSDERRRSRDSISKTLPTEQSSTLPRSTITSTNTKSMTKSSMRISASDRSLKRPAYDTTGGGLDDEARGRAQHRVEQYLDPRRVPDPFVFFPDQDRSPSPVSSIHDGDSGLGIVWPSKDQSELPSMLPPHLIPELQALASSTTKTPPLQTKQRGPLSSPSSVYSDSPGPWSATSTGTPATSLSSASPGLTRPVSTVSSNKWSKSTAITTSSKSKVPRLPALQETPPVPSLASLNSKPDQRGRSRSESTSHLSLSDSLGPTPPPRSSSVKRRRNRSASREKDDGTRRDAAKSGGSQSGAHLASNARTRDKEMRENNIPPMPPAITRAHADLQQSISTFPPRPLREVMRSAGPAQQEDLSVARANSKPSRPQRESIGGVQESTRLTAKLPALEANQKRNQALAITDDPPASPSRSSRFTKFGFFGRSTTSALPEPERVPKKLQRKGPAAGTGYEAYGKPAPRVRKPATEVSKLSSESDRSGASSRKVPATGSRQFSNSSTRANRGSQSDLDEFVAARTKPVWMIGGSGAGGASGRADLNGHQMDGESDLHGEELPFVMAQADSSLANLEMSGALDADTEATNQQRFVAPRNLAPIRHSGRFGSDDLDKRAPSSVQVPTIGRVRASSVDTLASSIVAPSRVSSSLAGDTPRFDVSVLKSPEKKSRKINWNIFRRRKKVSEPNETEIPTNSNQTEVVVSVTTTDRPKRTPYYTVMDSEIEVHNPDMMGSILAEAMGSEAEDLPNVDDEDEEEETEEIQVYRQTRPESILLPPAPSFPVPARPSSPERIDPLSQTTTESKTDPVVPPPRRPRLAQVGRIPQVAPRGLQNNAEKRPSVSRHFQNFLPAARQAVRRSGIPVLVKKPALEVHTDILPSKPFTSEDSAKPASAPAELMHDPQVLPFSYSPGAVRWLPQYPSEISISSSSDGVRSVLAPSLMPSEFEIPIMYRPSMRSVDIVHEEDEVWNEYDELIDHVMSPSKSLNSNPARNARVTSKLTPRGRVDSSTIRESKLLGRAMSGTIPKVPPPKRERTKLVIETSLPRSMAPPVVFPAIHSLKEQGIGEDIRLRRSRIVSALHSPYDPASPFSMRDFLNEYGPYWRESARKSGRHSISTIGRSSYATTTSGTLPTSLSLLPSSPVTQQDNAALVDSVERSKDPIALSELHFTSLMVSRWLSFGRVLFSPAHNELHNIPDRHVLVIDGLGNEDWAIYCAVTYEAQKAMVHDLKEKGVRGTPRRTSQNSPPNLRRSEVTSFADRFPFPASFFSAVVLRFPPAMSEARLKNILSESKKVLAPGGYIEIMLLDIDIVNMGIQTRRAVRDLKIKMHSADPDISLRPLIDNTQTLLGHEGFTNLSRCVVGVPVHGPVGGSGDSSSRSSRGSDGNPKRTSRDADLIAKEANIKTPRQQHQEGFSLNDLVADHSENADAQIGKMVSLTARSWWQRCFEAAVISDGDLSHSIFADKRVLQECKMRGSSFKLLIAHAQRPVYALRRRTVSEPTVPTLATANADRVRGPTKV